LVVVAVGTLLGKGLLLATVYVVFTNLAIVLGGLELWSQNRWTLILIMFLGLAGFGVLFGLLFLLRGEERTNPTLRRLIYGYNTVLTGILLFGVLAVVNFLIYVPITPFKAVNKTYDWTEDRTFSLDKQTQQFLENLDQNVEINVILPTLREGDADETYKMVSAETRALLKLVEPINRQKVTINYIAPENTGTELRRLQKDYGMRPGLGVFLIYGTQPKAKTAMISVGQMFEGGDERFGRSAEPQLYVGERELLTQLRSLKTSFDEAEGKVRKVIYFTQDNGELRLGNSGHAGPEGEDGLGMLKNQLAKVPYEVRALDLLGPNDKVPNDAAVVVVAGPSKRFSPDAIKALNEYMGLSPLLGEDGKPKQPRQGQMIVLFDVRTTTNSQMAPTLEEFVSQFGFTTGNSL
jgi:hypothetical protein